MSFAAEKYASHGADFFLFIYFLNELLLCKYYVLLMENED